MFQPVELNLIVKQLIIKCVSDLHFRSILMECIYLKIVFLN